MTKREAKRLACRIAASWIETNVGGGCLEPAITARVGPLAASPEVSLARERFEALEVLVGEAITEIILELDRRGRP